ncbi:hypothetical protein EUX98_g1019 [Antrodiella citrinella]|uniref:Dopey N-terminal domain-containing protein n=1 Tax=Antrodiella citrinella TaxID=2447956 RepID=A0A4S4NB16_9APHY|nr:hypothetical protein EUX98_g1019 [Antrodiella citrinella]
MEDVDMDAPQISTLPEEGSPEPRQSAARVPKPPRVKLRLSEGKTPVASTSSSLARQIGPNSEDEDEDEDEDEEDQLIDDDDDDIRPPPPTITIPVTLPAPPPLTTTSARGTAAKRGVGRGRGGGRKRGAKTDAPSKTTITVPPMINSTPEGWNSPSGSVVSAPPTTGRKRGGPGSRGGVAQRAIRKRGPRGGKGSPAVPRDDAGSISEAYAGTAASSPMPHDEHSPEPEVHTTSILVSAPLDIDMSLEGIPLPVYPLPSKPFPVQPPPKIGSGFAPAVPLDKNGKHVRKWRQAHREIRGIAGGRWFTRAWIGDKESEFAAAQAAAAAALQNAMLLDRDPLTGSASVPGVMLPSLTSISISGTGKSTARGKAKAALGLGTGQSSRAASTAPDSISAALPTARKRFAAMTPGKSPAAKARDRGVITSAYANDPKFKKYTQQVEKCLASFDNVHEWADFISFLKQLLKTFQIYLQFKEIPKKLVVAKRLSQCLNPALPTGVHQRALDVYSHILAVLGSEGLQRDLALWSSGLFPFFEYAATSVKVLALLDRLSGTVAPSFFLQNIWLIMLTSPSARGTSINFLSRRLPHLNADEDITTIVGRDIGLMIRAFSAALEDDDLLADMFSPSTEYAQSRPFKIFVSLLDKWEIGSALTETLVLDAFKAIKMGIDSGRDTGEDMTMTASTLYEAIEPYALWRQLLKSVLSDLEGGGSSYEADRLQPRFVMDERQRMKAMLEPLLRYLRPEWATYHMRSVSLIWLLERSSNTAHIESIISQTLSTNDPYDMQEACEAFGVLWRLTDDALVPGFRLKVPMMIVLDTLKSENPNLRRVGETWMRCCLKSYLRILDPILFDLQDPQILRVRSVEEHNGRSIHAFRYERPFDQRYISHLLDSLLSIVKFGGQGFSKVAKSAAISRTTHSGVLERIQGAGNPADSSYMDVIIDMLLRFLQSEPKPTTGTTMNPLNAVMQSTTVDLLQALIVRGEIDTTSLQTIESVIVGKLFLSVHTHRLDLQNKLLHVLHSIISVFSAEMDTKPNRLSRSIVPEGDGGKPDQTSSSRTAGYTVNPLLLQTLLDGLAVRINRPVLQHWLDFILMTVPQYKGMLQSMIIPLTDCICRQLRSALQEILQASKKASSTGDAAALTTDADFIMLLNALERLVSLSLSHVALVVQDEDETSVAEKTDGSGLLGYVSNVFSSDGASLPTEESFSKSSDYRCLRESVRVLYVIWISLIIPPSHTPSSQDESLILIFTRSRTRCRRVLEHLFRAHAAEVLECIIECWSLESSDDSAAFDLVDVLTPNAQNVVHMICESITTRTPFIQEKAVRRQATNPSLTELTLFEFLEQYARRLEGPVAVQVWSRFSQLAKDIGSNLREFKIIAFATLRCFTVLADKVSQTTVVEDRRVRKELQDIYTKLLDICLLVSRSPEGSWIRKGSALNTNGRDSPQIRDVKLDEKMNVSTSSLPDAVKPAWGLDVLDRVNLYIASDVVLNLRKFLADPDKVLAACSSIVSSVINPAMKGRSRYLSNSAAMKAWRAPIVEVLNDNRCFNSTPAAGHKWRMMVKMLFDTDKTALVELLSRVTTAPSANIFTNREYEMLLRSLNLRRLSYVLLSGEKNHFLTQLPTIQEKLVDTLRNVNAPIVQSEVYLCIRVLLCRLSPHNLSSFWPTILTELYRLFEQVMVSIPADGSEELGLLLSASKLLDLLLVLQTEEFQIHQWIFITDTVDAIYRPDDCEPEALLDRLAEVVGDLPAADVISIALVNICIRRTHDLFSADKPFGPCIACNTYHGGPARSKTDATICAAD